MPRDLTTEIAKLEVIQKTINEKTKVISLLSTSRKKSSEDEPSCNSYSIVDKWKIIAKNSLFLNIIALAKSVKNNTTTENFLYELKKEIIDTIKQMDKQNPYFNEEKAIDEIKKIFEQSQKDNDKELEACLEELANDRTNCLVELNQYNEIIRECLIEYWEQELNNLKTQGIKTQIVEEELKELKEKIEILKNITLYIPNMTNSNSHEVIFKDIHTDFFENVAWKIQTSKRLQKNTTLSQATDVTDGKHKGFLNSLGLIILEKILGKKDKSDSLSKIIENITKDPTIDKVQVKQSKYELPKISIKLFSIGFGTYENLDININRKKVTRRDSQEDFAIKTLLQSAYQQGLYQVSEENTIILNPNQNSDLQRESSECEPLEYLSQPSTSTNVL